MDEEAKKERTLYTELDKIYSSIERARSFSFGNQSKVSDIAQSIGIFLTVEKAEGRDKEKEVETKGVLFDRIDAIHVYLDDLIRSLATTSDRLISTKARMGIKDKG